MTLLKATLCGLTVFVTLVTCTGCSKDFLDPSQVGRFRPTPVVNVILDSLGVADEPDPTYLGAEDPLPEDLYDYEQDYVFGSGDLVRISIYELRRQGFPFINDYIVTESGRISVPDVGQIRATGLTEVKLEEEIKDILSPAILKDPSVSVLLLQSQRRMFSIYGQGVTQSGRYSIPRYIFRLTDAIALAGDVGQFNVSYIYISRDVSTGQLSSVPYPSRNEQSPVNMETIELKPIDRTGTSSPEDDMLELIKPYSRNTSANDNLVITTAELVTEKELEDMALGGNHAAKPRKEPAVGLQDESTLQDMGRIEWVFENGKWVPKRVSSATTSAPARPEIINAIPSEPIALQERSAGQFGWDQIGKGSVKTRVIKIPIDKLKSGDPKYDIVIRPGDRISVPVDIIGEFTITGNVNNRGLINLTGRPLTLKMAIAAAGGLNGLAWPKKVEVIRRLGRNEAGLMQEEIVMVDLEKIANGQQPDFFIKPHDLVNVGTHGMSRYLAVLRNAFRATYGFGFLYDRNFAYPSSYYGDGGNLF